MLPLYLSDTTAALIFWTMFGAWALVELATYLRLRHAAHVTNRDRGSLVVLIAGYWLALFIAFAVAAGGTFAVIGWHRHLLLYTGIGMMLGGLIVRQYAIRTLGRLHTLEVATRPAQPVVVSGPYRWVRHPSYAGAMLTAAGILLCSTNWLSLMCYLLVAGAYGYRIWVEELALVADLGDSYRAYMRRTKRLVPYLI